MTPPPDSYPGEAHWRRQAIHRKLVLAVLAAPPAGALIGFLAGSISLGLAAAGVVMMGCSMAMSVLWARSWQEHGIATKRRTLFEGAMGLTMVAAVFVYLAAPSGITAGICGGAVALALGTMLVGHSRDMKRFRAQCAEWEAALGAGHPAKQKREDQQP